MKICSECSILHAFIVRGYCIKCYNALKYKGKLENIKKESVIQLTDIQNEHLIGSMLGDGCIRKNKTTKNSYLKIERSIKDLDYLKYEFNLFSNLCRSGVKTYTRKEKSINGKYLDSCYFITLSQPILEDFRNKWYKNGKKILPDDVTLTPYIIAIWLADDGCISIHHKKQNLLITVFATNSFQKNEAAILAEKLTNRYNLNFTIQKTSIKNQYTINAGHYATMAMYEDIKNIFPISMNRKFKNIK